MANVAAGTIAQRSTLPEARRLATSFRKQHPTTPFYILVVDATPADTDIVLERKELTLNDLGVAHGHLHALAARYTAFEFVRSLKAIFLTHLLDLSVDEAWLFDADTVVFSPLTLLSRALEKSPIALVPRHANALHAGLTTAQQRTMHERGVFSSAVIGVTRGSRSFLQWWDERLRYDCLDIPSESLYYDQRHLDAAPALFDVAVIREANFLVGPWNVDGSDLGREGETRWTLNGKPIVVGSVRERSRTSAKSQRLDHADEFFSMLATNNLDAVEGAGGAYRFAESANGIVLDTALRRAIRLQVRRRPQVPPPDPFDEKVSVVFADWITSNVGPNFLILPSALRELWGSSPELQDAFPNIGSTDAKAFCNYVMNNDELGKGLQRMGHETGNQLVPMDRPLESNGWNLIGAFDPDTETGELNGRLRLALDNILSGTHVIDQSVGTGKKKRKHGAHARAKYANAVVFLDERSSLTTLTDHHLGRYNGGRLSAVWLGTSRTIPSEWVAMLSNFDHVGVLSTALAEELASRLPVPVEFVKVNVGVAPATPRVKRRNVGFDDRFTYYSVVDASQGLESANVSAIADAYRDAFGTSEGTRLVLRIRNAANDASGLELLRAQCSNRDDVDIRTDEVGFLTIVTETETADCYVALPEFEGFGLHVAHAVSFGRPVIVTRVGGPLDFLHPDHARFIEPLAAGSSRDLTDVSEAMKLTLMQAALTQRMALAGKAALRDEFSLENSELSLKALFESDASN